MTPRHVCIALPLFMAPAPAQELTEQSFARWRELVLPSAEDLRFAEIPWRESLREAVLEAEREQKPVLLWAMNGHPLGCT